MHEEDDAIIGWVTTEQEDRMKDRSPFLLEAVLRWLKHNEPETYARLRAELDDEPWAEGATMTVRQSLEERIQAYGLEIQ